MKLRIFYLPTNITPVESEVFSLEFKDYSYEEYNFH